MDGPSFFPEAIRAIAAGLREGGYAHPRLNRAEAAIDHLGRQLHGLGYVRSGEIADSFTAALGELSAAHPLPEEQRGTAVHRAVVHLEAALEATAAGILPAAS
ncbi:MAG TPA: hypothetical protein VHG08_20335 [Longimicrobium sp.]|nr:hypothetical protein [Longimicrobium sp.]